MRINERERLMQKLRELQGVIARGGITRLTDSETVRQAADELSQPAAPAAPAPAWQPIETAPKNCVDVLLNIPGRQPVVAAFYRGGWAPVDLGGNHLRGTPTHWMPLPEAPAIAASKGGA
jgi:hypothetical protein